MSATTTDFVPTHTITEYRHGLGIVVTPVRALDGKPIDTNANVKRELLHADGRIRTRWSYYLTPINN